MSLPPALLQRLAQRGLVQKKKKKNDGASVTAAPVESEEVIAEDYDEMDTEAHRGPEEYDHERVKRPEENFWAERMRARMGETISYAGYKGCPNKYNIWHKCNVFCVNRWENGRPEPGRDYMRRYKRLLRKYPLPKGWTEMYDPGCGCHYFSNAAEGMVSWLPPTHPKSQVAKSAASIRRQMEEAAGGGDSGSDGEQQLHEDEDEEETSAERHQREVDEIIASTMRARSPQQGGKDFPSLHDAAKSTGQVRKPKTRDLDRALSRSQRDKERRPRRGRGGADTDALDPMDPSAYSDTPRGKWSDGLTVTPNEERKKAPKEDVAKRPRRSERSSDEEAEFS